MNQDIAVREHGALSTPMAPGFLDPATAASYLVESGVMGKTPKAQVVVRIMIGAELGVGPVTSARLIHTFDNQGRMVIELDATLMTALINNSGRYSYKEIQNDANGVVLDFYDRGVLKGTASFGPKDAAKAKLNTKDNYIKYDRDMYFARAISRGFDHYCAELGCGLPVIPKDEIDEMPMGHDQRKAIFAGLKPYEMSDDERHDWASDILGRRVDSFAEGQPSCPTRREATMLLAWLENTGGMATDDGVPVAGEIVTAGEAERAEPREEGRDETSERDAYGWVVVPGSGAGKVAGAGATGLGEVPQAPAPVATHVTNLVAEQSTLDVLMTELEAVRGKRSPKVVDGWLQSWLDNEKLIGIEHADEEQAERGLSWLRAQFGARR